MDNLATWMTYKMYQSYILGISFKPEFYKSGLSLPGMFANIWIGQRDFELTSPNSLFQISISWYHRQVHRKTLYTGLRRQTKAQGTHPFSKAGLTGAQVARLFIGAPDKRGLRVFGGTATIEHWLDILYSHLFLYRSLVINKTLFSHKIRWITLCIHSKGYHLRVLRLHPSRQS